MMMEPCRRVPFVVGGSASKRAVKAAPTTATSALPSGAPDLTTANGFAVSDDRLPFGRSARLSGLGHPRSDAEGGAIVRPAHVIVSSHHGSLPCQHHCG